MLMMAPSDARTFRSGALAKAAGVSPDTIRHYEKIGVLPKASRTASGYRIYPETAVQRVAVVQRALRIGFTLAELAEVFKARDSGGAPCHRVYELAQQKLTGIRADIETLESTEAYLSKVLSNWKRRIKEARPGQKAHLLHSLSGTASLSPNGPDKFRRNRES